MNLRHSLVRRSATLLARRRAILLGMSVTLLLAAWTAANRPFSGPDEIWHYLRSVTIANGHILGPKISYAPAPWLTPPQLAWISRDTRAVVVSARLSPPFNPPCGGGRGSCAVKDPNGNFPPYGYLLPALAIKVSHHTSTAVWLTRIASALQSLVFLLLAVALLYSGTGLSLLGVIAATSPMVLFVSSVMNPSGLETTACLAFAASVLRLTRPPRRAPRWVWAAFAVSGAVAVVSWPLGLAFVLADLLLFAVLLGRDGARELYGANRRWVQLSGLVLLAAGVLWVVYSRVADLGAGKFGVTPFWHSIDLGLRQFHEVLRQAVGRFGSLTVPLPTAAYWIWWLFIAALVATALWLGRRKDRLVVAGVAVLALAFPILFYAWVDRFSGFGLQGREVLPVLMLIPLVAGEIVYRRALSAPPRATHLAMGGVIGGFGLFQAFAWWVNAKTNAGAPHMIGFYAHARWSPSGGWIPWVVIACLGTVGLLAFAATEAGGPLALPATVPYRARRSPASIEEV